MPRLFRLALVAIAMLVIWAAPAYAAPRPAPTIVQPPPLPGTNTVIQPGYPNPAVTANVETTHFVVWYTTQPSTAYHITETKANDIAAWAEQAYAKYVGSWGYPAPRNDGDGKTDIYVGDLVGVFSQLVPDIVYPDSDVGLASTAFIDLDVTNGLNLHTVARAVFDAIELGIWNPSNRFMIEAPAEWAANQVDGLTAAADPNSTGPAEIALDCFDFTFFPVGHNCAHVGETGSPPSDIQSNGYSRWTFFQLLAERYGTGFVKDVLQRGYASGSVDTSPIDMLANALSAKGTSLPSFYLDWSVANMNGAFSAKRLQNVTPKIYQTVPTGTLASLNDGLDPSQPEILSDPQPLVPLLVPVEHLATRYLAIIRGDGTDTGLCYAATLSLTVTWPSNITSKPYFFWTQKDSLGKYLSTAQPLAVSGTTATLSIPWDTCKWTDTVGILSLPNASFSSNPATLATYDGQEFSITHSITINKSVIATATAPPKPVVMPGTVLDVPGDDVVPLIDVFGPQLLRVSASKRVLQLIVSSSGPGSLRAVLGSRALGSTKLRAGNNNVQFKLPASLFASPRRTAAVSVLRLTPVSAGGVTGKAVIRKVKVEAAKVKKVAAKTVKKHAQH